ncbi:MAG TPA: dephospho-CoA kinase [Rhizomicrobium sp.]|jgi:dephospho-CoA kinase|nr:dephospho-CoA kinase [Rhizomicrobium sp.]
MPGKPFIIGLTGSIAMGKSETAKLFAAEGVWVHDADAAIHKLYGKGGAAVAKIAEAFPGTVRDGAVDRAALSARVAGDPQALEKLESLVHPLVAEERDAFLRAAEQKGEAIVLLDIPLLFETGAEAGLDALVVASAPAMVQRTRALSRPGMTAEKFESLLSRQLPDVDKRARAHFVVVTDKGQDHARDQVRMILTAIREKIQNNRHA